MMTKEIGLMLYWAEGDKTNKYFVALTNTDPKMLKYFVTWLKKYYNIDEKRLRCRLYIWENFDETKAKEFWSKTLGIDSFTKSYVKKSKPNIRKVRHKYGVCRVSYSSKEIFAKIQEDIFSLFMQ